MKKKTKLPLPLRIIRWSFPKLESFAPKLAGKWAWKLFFNPFRFPPSKKEIEAASLASKFRFEAGEETIQGYEWGKGKKVVLLLHGWAGRGTQLLQFIDPLKDAGYRVVTIDGPAHGQSTGKSTHILHYADAILKAKQLYPNMEAVIAHSFGGAATIQAVRLGLDIKSVVTIGAPTVGDYIISDFLRRINGSQKSGELFKQNVIKQFNRSFDEFSIMNSIGVTKAKFEMLMIHDEDDKEVPVQHAKDVKAIAPWVDLLITTGLGHMRILKNQEVIHECVDFVSSKNMELV